MIQTALDTHLFCLRRPAYIKIRRMGLLLLGAFLLIAFVALIISLKLLPTYSHTFTPYIKWQDALVALLWFIAFITLFGCGLILRFLHALYAGYTRYTIKFNRDNSLTVRDLSSENLLSVFWIVNNVFWCFVAVLVGLLPAMLIGWTLRLSPRALAVIATFIIGVIGIAGLALSVILATFVIIGCIGGISLSRDLGAIRTYRYSSHVSMHINNSVLTIISPGVPESMLDLKLLETGDQNLLLFLLREHWPDAQLLCDPSSDEAAEETVREAHGVLLEPMGS